MSVRPSAEVFGPEGYLATLFTDSPRLTPTVTPPGMAIIAPKTMTTINEDGPIILIPKPSDDADDPLNWSISKKIIIFACICFAGFAGQMSPNSNQLTFTLQVPNYVDRTQADMLNTVAASL
ncbi:hypothetical protein O988_06315, partial [Pseudogymnoascus sp. VKM F-3808]